ncbi:hypothetical protein P152DRAFT_452926 [Eremomyces bilateralis CBS 781.70]|uniref:Uncharacterized protein n=1 Tax=Eremomyces bilateralis CBS 781.70 TaxID=1392243 RepID=A0A6G1FRJ3_9PEZI|nr:uncharacterized protein P152DRAFT_452926 [Eremomyces bilateralis CBS 781.70]KAF1808348.1 hypothetical protein P152DRAFT_452926 [Eremomyces bilateralis CBS 781.70]
MNQTEINRPRSGSEVRNAERRRGMCRTLSLGTIECGPKSKHRQGSIAASMSKKTSPSDATSAMHALHPESRVHHRIIVSGNTSEVLDRIWSTSPRLWRRSIGGIGIAGPLDLGAINHHASTLRGRSRRAYAAPSPAVSYGRSLSTTGASHSSCDRTAAQRRSLVPSCDRGQVGCEPATGWTLDKRNHRWRPGAGQWTLSNVKVSGSKEVRKFGASHTTPHANF